MSAFLFNLAFPINLHVVSRLQSDARFAFLESTNWLSSMRSDQFAVSLFCNHTISAQFMSLSPPTNNCVPPDWFGVALKYKSALCSSDSIRNVGASGVLDSYSQVAPRRAASTTIVPKEGFNLFSFVRSQLETDISPTLASANRSTPPPPHLPGN